MQAILANGDFPTHEVPLAMLRTAERVMCCDGALLKLVNSGLGIAKERIVAVGDGDSLTESLKKEYHFVHISEQESNDLSKNVHHLLALGADDVVILGATGLREDHTLGNISLLADYAVQYPETRFRMLSDYGIFTPVVGRRRFVSFAGQQVSLFQFAQGVRVTTQGLRWPLNGRSFGSLWQGTLNAVEGDAFEIVSQGGVTVVYQTPINNL